MLLDSRERTTYHISLGLLGQCKQPSASACSKPCHACRELCTARAFLYSDFARTRANFEWIDRGIFALCRLSHTSDR
jgi:hypothetical protein